MMKSLLLLSLSLCVISVTACAPTTLSASAPTQANLLSDSALNAGVKSFDLQLFVADAAGQRNPVSPDQLQSLQLGQRAIAVNTLVLPGAAADAALLASPSQQRARLSDVVSSGKSLVIYRGSGVYSVFEPASEQDSSLSVQLKGAAAPHLAYLPAGMTGARLVLKPEAEVEGALQYAPGFSLKQEQASVLALLQAALAQWKPGADNPFEALLRMQGNSGTLRQGDDVWLQLLLQAGVDPSATPFVPTDEQLNRLFAALEQQEESLDALQKNAQAALLLRIAGRWQPESSLVQSLVPGGKLVLALAFAGDSSYQATAELADANYSSSGSLPALSVNGDSLGLQIAQDGRALALEVKVLNDNRLSVTLKGATGADQLKGLVGSELFLNRVL
ncbi:MAG: hypothetical protein ACO1RX_03295 [Candidatus Sericytochromatia bacterium]